MKIKRIKDASKRHAVGMLVKGIHSGRIKLFTKKDDKWYCHENGHTYYTLDETKQAHEILDTFYEGDKVEIEF